MVIQGGSMKTNKEEDIGSVYPHIANIMQNFQNGSKNIVVINHLKEQEFNSLITKEALETQLNLLNMVKKFLTCYHLEKGDGINEKINNKKIN